MCKVSQSTQKITWDEVLFGKGLLQRIPLHKKDSMVGALLFYEDSRSSFTEEPLQLAHLVTYPCFLTQG